MNATKLIGIMSLTIVLIACKTSDKFGGASVLRTFSPPDSANTAVVLVHGWGKTPRRPNFVWRLKIRPYTDLSALLDSFLAAGFSNVNLVDYDDEASLDDMAKSVAEQIQAIVAKANNPNLKLDVIAHSLGQFVSLKAILDYSMRPDSQERISEHVRIFVGLAGAARGQDEIRPCRVFPNQCGGAELLTPFYKGPGQGSPVIDKLFSANSEAINKLKKCSLFARGDEIVDSPYNSGSFSGLQFAPDNMKDVEILYQGSRFHKDVKDSPEIINTMLTSCYSMVQ